MEGREEGRGRGGRRKDGRNTQEIDHVHPVFPLVRMQRNDWFCAPAPLKRTADSNNASLWTLLILPLDFALWRCVWLQLFCLCCRFLPGPPDIDLFLHPLSCAYLCASMQEHLAFGLFASAQLPLPSSLPRAQVDCAWVACRGVSEAHDHMRDFFRGAREKTFSFRDHNDTEVTAILAKVPKL